MTDNIPTEGGLSFPAPGGTGAAAGVEVSDDHGSGPDENDYDKLLASIGRTYEDDIRIAAHESGHALCARLLGNSVGGVTVNPDPVRRSEGMCWGIGHAEAFATGGCDASDVRDALAAEMPQDGEDRSGVVDIFANAYAHCIELMAGRAAERILLDDEPAPPADDLRQARELALLFCRSEKAVGSFVAHCEIAARDLLMPHGDVLIALSTVLRIKRTLTGAEIDTLIADVQAGKALAEERRRREEWRDRVLAAKRFEAEVIIPKD